MPHMRIIALSLLLVLLASSTAFANEDNEGIRPPQKPPKEVKLWPFLSYGSDENETKLSILYPLIEYEKTKERELLSLYPLVSRTKLDYETRFDFFFPFSRYLSAGVYRRTSDETECYFHPLFNYSSDRTKESFSLSLLYFLSFSSSPSELSFHIFPLLWYERNKEADSVEVDFLYPLGRYSSEPDSFRLRFFPFFGYSRRDSEVVFDFLFPLGRYKS
ncbi:MAG: hypothetical protein N2234_00710, partial [Planctomycetota bacterium]|nr:hypothetical protein [Planctomycetota bacterium]